MLFELLNARRYASAALALGLLLSAASGADREPRFSQLRPDQLHDAQPKIAGRILKVSSAGLGGPYNMLLRSPRVISA